MTQSIIDNANANWRAALESILRDCTQVELAERLGVSTMTIWRWTHERTDPALEYKIKLMEMNHE